MGVAHFWCIWFSSNQKSYEMVLCICASGRLIVLVIMYNQFPEMDNCFKMLFFFRKCNCWMWFVWSLGVNSWRSKIVANLVLSKFTSFWHVYFLPIRTIFGSSNVSIIDSSLFADRKKQVRKLIIVVWILYKEKIS